MYTANLSCKLDLKKIASKLNLEYNPKKFPGLTIKIEEPKTTALIFENGKMVLLGSKNEQEYKNACNKVLKILKDLKYNASLKDFKIQNIIASCNIQFEIHLSKLFVDLSKLPKQNASYRPEIFPGLIYKFPNYNVDIQKGGNNPNLIFQIYSSGNIVITGAKTMQQINDAFDKTYPLLYKCKNESKFNH